MDPQAKTAAKYGILQPSWPSYAAPRKEACPTGGTLTFIKALLRLRPSCASFLEILAEA